MPASPGPEPHARTSDAAAGGKPSRTPGDRASAGAPRPGDRAASKLPRRGVRPPGQPRQGGLKVGHRPRRTARRAGAPAPHAAESAFARRHGITPARIGALGLLAALIAGLVGLLGGQAYWLCVPAALLATAESRTRAGVAVITAALVAAGEGAGIASAAHGRPPLVLALLVPAASVSVLLALRERLEAQREALRRSALTDPLTGLANRRSLLARIDYEVSRHTRARRPFGVMMLDLDGFKALNDRFGHPAGDDLLRDVSAAIARAIRDQ
ncbi:MAG: hypothetical protein QOG59_642, partial [Solirubrobacteraceae bacterium]|nr:hypothetical protein [Solirubrobacteraceae bacterium]